ncbi:hypothetical protein DLAC_05399 [Tieghemostelium lacteum]|uniref:Uncharacterized protein n=1 Tax=Tieghemostelium lacteum TaxID=361077 RepID=A0A151ZG15_TIELA|nr:hypothetical protein DLAC_05399 [Tieghemostelium lacteum]|eukprot:KYQ92814.1 hypothetical protein DLAC_05399 [Tieghemostelium lacteum]
MTSINNFKIKREDFTLDFDETDKYFIGQSNLMTPKKILIQGHRKSFEKENVLSPKQQQFKISSPTGHLTHLSLSDPPSTPLSPKTDNFLNISNGNDNVFTIPEPKTPKSLKQQQQQTPSKLKPIERSNTIFTTPIKYNISSNQSINYCSFNTTQNEPTPMDLSTSVTTKTSSTLKKPITTSTITPVIPSTLPKKPPQPVIVSPTLNNKRVQHLKKMDDKTSIKNEVHPSRLSISKKPISKPSSSTVSTNVGVKRPSITPSQTTTLVNKPSNTKTTTTSTSTTTTKTITSTTIDSSKRLKSTTRLSTIPSQPTSTSVTTSIPKQKRLSMINPVTSSASLSSNSTTSTSTSISTSTRIPKVPITAPKRLSTVVVQKRKSISPITSSNSGSDDDFEKRLQEAMEAEANGLQLKQGSALLTSPEKKELENKRSKWSPIKKIKTCDDIYACTKKFQDQ